MPTCPGGHESAADDYCDVCGEQMPPPLPDHCPACREPRSGGAFCESCGHAFSPSAPRATGPAERHAAEPGEAGPAGTAADDAGARPASPVPGGTGVWFAVVEADPDYFAEVQAQDGPDTAALRFPEGNPARRVPLVGDKVRIGRRSTSRGLLPEIDLSVPPADPGVSHAHAVLVAGPDGRGWTVIDTGSTNGTTINGSPDPIPVNVAVPVGDGDRVHVGAWTTITLSLDERGPAWS
ncbi:FHA domain-containing protein [Actinomadura atramentaria]|uniref:FHA domain-containing protein n=1 Tax=Actinomadura atramentaria TaxID=1990 RepID=UPI0005251531|nr:FHA domain-containing protein [Actinomadura atramentaria]